MSSPCGAPNEKCVDLESAYACECVDGYTGAGCATSKAFSAKDIHVSHCFEILALF